VAASGPWRMEGSQWLGWVCLLHVLRLAAQVPTFPPTNNHNDGLFMVPCGSYVINLLGAAGSRFTGSKLLEQMPHSLPLLASETTPQLPAYHSKAGLCRLRGTSVTGDVPI
jgi:hypothetical protein